MNKIPSVCVLMATFNGEKYLAEQIESILQQSYVNLTVVVSDDLSTDNTLSILNRYKDGKRFILLDTKHKFGSASQNFFSLLKRVSFDHYDYVSFADQDDLWDRDKLITSIKHIEIKKVAGFSSDVVAFWGCGRKQYIKKSGRNVAYDFLFESGGPGCTFVITKKLANSIKNLLILKPDISARIFWHDWLIYAYARFVGYGWYIHNQSTMLYRQHETNVTGANNGISAAIARLKYLCDGFYFEQVFLVSKAIGSVHLLYSILGKSRCYNLQFIKYWFKCRRSLKEAFLLLVFVFFGFARIRIVK